MGRFIFVSFGLLVVFLSLSGMGAHFECPSDWSSYDQYCYNFFQQKMTWEDAERFCSEQAKGGHLVSFQSDGETDFVAQLVAERIDRPQSHVWIGLRGEHKGQQCSSNWSDGSCVCYENLVERRTKKCFVLEGREGKSMCWCTLCYVKEGALSSMRTPGILLAAPTPWPLGTFLDLLDL